MLEDRLSKTYHQNIPGYTLPSSLQQPAYPNVQSPAAGASSAKIENYYTASPPAEPYGRQPSYAGYPPKQSPYVQQSAPQRPQFTSQPSDQTFSPTQPYPPQQFYDANAPRTQTRSSSVSYQPSEPHVPPFQRNPSEQQQYAPQPAAQPPPMTPSQPPGTAPDAAAFYFPDRQPSVSQQQQPSAPLQTPTSPIQQRQPSTADVPRAGVLAGPSVPPQAQQQPLPAIVQAMATPPQAPVQQRQMALSAQWQSQQPPPQQQPLPAIAQAMANPPQAPVQQRQMAPPAQWQPQQPPPPQQQQQNPPYPAEYPAQNFPAVPQPKVEEALIEL
jgi:hypothetical protein